MFIELQGAYFVLRAWKNNPKLSKKQIGIFSHWKDDGPENERPLTEDEVERFKQFLREHAPTSYYELFPKHKDEAD